MRARGSWGLSRRFFLGASVTALVSSVVGAVRAGQSSEPAAARQAAPAFEPIGVPVTYSPARSHAYIADMQRWHDRIYIGHGDWDDNTGPVRAIYYDVAGGSFVHDDAFQFDDEAVESLVVLDDALYAVGIDAKESWDFGNIYRKRWGQTWEKLRTLPGGVHVFGLGQLADVLVATGSNDRTDGLIWQSGDDGQTFEIATVVRNASLGTMFPIQVYSHVLTLGDRLFVATPDSGFYAFDGAAWSEADWRTTTRFGVTKSVRFGAVLVMVPYLPFRGPSANPSERQVIVFDGAEDWSVDVGATVRDVVADGDTLYVLIEREDETGAILAATDISCRCADAFVEIAAIGADFPRPRSLERVHDRFYIGCADGMLVRSGPYGG